MMTPFFFYGFAGLTVFFASLVILSKNTMHAVFSLILTFLSAAGLFVLAGAEFLAMVLIVVYVGAVAVLFLFVVMMLGNDVQKTRRRSFFYLLLSLVVGFSFAGCFYTLLISVHSFEDGFYLNNLLDSFQDNTSALGDVLFTTYFLPFQITALLLLVAMIGAIVLTIHRQKSTKRQNVALQNQRVGAESIRRVSVPLRRGI